MEINKNKKEEEKLQVELYDGMNIVDMNLIFEVK